MTPDALAAEISQLGLPEGLGWAVTTPQTDPGALFPEERAAMQKAVPARLAEFTGGRVAARRAMAQLGLTPGPVAMDPDRAPRWPEGLVGSITHAAGFCFALVSHISDWRAIGADLERDAALPDEIVAEVATPQELASLAPLPARKAAARIFSAKEAAYKAQYPLTRCLFGFDAMQADLPAGEMRMIRDTGPGMGAALPMRQHLLPGLILSLCLMPANS
ncbi:4'-phosphopantetheinyl transferase family protein [Salipiger abyssi]|uniref:4'-phosphopantetheinyl transferase family protein n=1 Tax=Salipiger abyssi TaxID=1250539 RepID=UPI001A8F9F76|nr:4'-phosphopantetheinyl transferase superfamily protein [Salipiger abyssi]MBN9886025.1 4'-phosphopantetheinyl transferase superfamily protein [Salipiger abyssi]